MPEASRFCWVGSVYPLVPDEAPLDVSKQLLFKVDGRRSQHRRQQHSFPGAPQLTGALQPWKLGEEANSDTEPLT